MSHDDIRTRVDATVEPLNDITRAAVWQRIEGAIAMPVPVRRWLPIATFAAGAAAAVLVLLALGWRDDGASTPQLERVVLDASDARPRRHVFAGGELTLHGPGRVELEAGASRTKIRVTSGTLIVRRAAGGPLELSSPGSTTTVSDPVVAIRVTELATEVAAGQARAMSLVSRHVEELSAPAPGAGEPSTPSSEVVPPPATVPAADPASASAIDLRIAPRSGAPDLAISASVQRAAPSTSAPGAGARTVAPRPIAQVTPSSDAGAQPDAGLEPLLATIDAGVTDPDMSVAATVETLADRYARAERAIAIDDVETSVELLSGIIRDDAGGRLAAAATYDLALLSYRRGDPLVALAWLEKLLANPVEPSLHGPARVLLCRIHTAQGRRCKD